MSDITIRAGEADQTKKERSVLVSAFLAEKTRTPPRIFLWWCFYIGGSFPKPLSEREGDRDSGGRSLRDFWVLISFIVTRSPSVAFGASSLPEGAFVHYPLRIVGSGFCQIVCGLPRAMLAPDTSVGKAEKTQSKEYLDLKQRIDNCFFINMCYNIITPVIKFLEVLLCNLI